MREIQKFRDDERDFFDVFGRIFEDFVRNSKDSELNISIYILNIF